MPKDRKKGETSAPVPRQEREQPPDDPRDAEVIEEDDPRDEPPPIIYGEEIEADALPPLVFVPGIMGTQLYRKNSPEPIWPPLGWWSQGDLKFRSLSHLVNGTEKEVGAQPATLFPAVYDGLIRGLTAAGYVLNENFFIFGYDWTQSNRTSGEQLAAYIDRIIADHPEWEWVDVVNHSMGGLVTRAAMRFGNPPIRRVAYLASPHYGACKAYFSLHGDIPIFRGFFEKLVSGYVWNNFLRKPGDEDTLEGMLKLVAGQMPSVYELLPDDFYLPKHPMVYVQHPSLESPVRSWRATYIVDRSKFASPAQRQLATDAMLFKQDLGARLPPAQNLVIYGGTIETTDRIDYRAYPTPLSTWSDPFDSGQKGDGTVNTASGSLGNDPTARPARGDHLGIPNNQNVVAMVLDFLTAP